MKLVTFNLKDLKPIDIGEFYTVRVVLSNGESFDLSENSNFPGRLLISTLNFPMEVTPRASNVILIRSEPQNV